MNTTDIVGSAGVFLLLVAFFLNLMKKLPTESRLYSLLNVVGGALACTASIMLHYIPFVVLEVAWTVVAMGGLFRHAKK